MLQMDRPWVNFYQLKTFVSKGYCAVRLCYQTLQTRQNKCAQLAGLPRPHWPGGGGAGSLSALPGRGAPLPPPRASMVLDALAPGQGCRHSSWQSTDQKAPVLFFIRTDLGTHTHSGVILPAKLWPRIVESLYFTNVVFTQADYSPLHTKSLVIHQACSSSIKWHHFKQRRDAPWRSVVTGVRSWIRETTVLPTTFHFCSQIPSNCHLFTSVFVNTLYFIIEFYSLLHFCVCEYTLFYYRILLIITGPECYDTNVPTATKVIWLIFFLIQLLEAKLMREITIPPD